MTFNPYFFNLSNLFAYSSGCKMFPGSETRSLVKNVPSSRALNFNLFFNDKRFCFPIKLIVIMFFKLL